MMIHLTKRMLRVLAVVTVSVIGGLTVSLLLLWTTFDTEYSAGFARQPWSRIAAGMSEADVKSLLGEPLSVVPWADKETETLNYSRSRSGNGNYVHYYIVIRDGEAVAQHRDIFWD